MCAWCGTELAPWYDGLYCSENHRKKQQEHRRKAAGFPVQACPHPEKLAYTYRGLALRKAVHYRQYPYLCRCGAFHLTKTPNTRFDTPIRTLLEEVGGEVA